MVRDQVWQLIKSLKNGRCIVMTTQHLQEAEELANQVALLDLGKIITKGTVDEIKKKFGIGYNLVLNVDKNEQQYEHEILKRIPGSYRDENQQKQQFVLPFKSVDRFPELF